MKAHSSILGRVFLGAATALALSFGAAQAFAAPGGTSGARLACDEFTCDSGCIAQGYALGTCTYKGFCRCYP